MGKTIRNNYQSIQEILALPEPTNETNLSIWNGTANNNHSENWYGPNGETMEQVIDYCTNGWEYGIEKTDKLKQQISIPVLESVKRKLTKGSEGDWLDIHAVNRGQLATAWTKKKRTNSRGPKRFQLVCKLGGAGYVSGEALLWRGVTCMALAQAIIEAGHAVEIIGFNNTKSVYQDGTGILNTLNIKEYAQPLDVGTLATVTGLAGFYRYYMFLARLQENKEATYGLGRSLDEPPAIESGQAQQIIIDPKIETKKEAEKFLEEVEL